MKYNPNSINKSFTKKILENDLLEDLFLKLGWEFRREYKGYRGKCFRPGSNGWNLKVRTDGSEVLINWACYSHQCHEKLKPTLLGFVRGFLSAEREEVCPIEEAIRFIKRIIDEEEVANSRARVQPRNKPLSHSSFKPISRDQVLKRLNIPSLFFAKGSRDFSIGVLKRFDVGYSRKLDREVCPLYDDTGKICLGIISRTNRPSCKECNGFHDRNLACKFAQPKWKRSIGELPRDYLYGFNQALLSPCPEVLVVEGPCDVWRAFEADKCAVALLGCSMNQAQIEKLDTLGKTIVLAPDNDAAGSNACRAISFLMEKQGIPHRIITYHLPGRKDLGEMSIEEVRELRSEPLEYYQSECLDEESEQQTQGIHIITDCPDYDFLPASYIAEEEMDETVF